MGVILLVAWNLIDFAIIKRILKISKTETSILLVTFFATLFLELEFAIYMGVMLSLILFLMRTSTPEIIPMAPDPSTESHRLVEADREHVDQCPQMKIISINMSVYFGSQDHIQKKLGKVVDKQGYRHVLILGRGINFIDMSGAEMLVEEAERLREMGGGLYMCGVKPNVCDYLIRSGFGAEFGPDNIFQKKSEAIYEVTRRINTNACADCTLRVFNECEFLPGGAKAEAREVG